MNPLPLAPPVSGRLMELSPGAFSGQPLIRKIDGARRWVLEEELMYRSRGGRTITVPVGFETDGASVPRPLWILYPPFGGEYDRAAIVHDYLYANAERFIGDDQGQISRGEVDRLMLEMMDVDEFRLTGRRMIYRGVRVGGWRPWGHYRQQAEKRASCLSS